MILDEKQFVFIVGADRSGTTWLQSLVGRHPQVATTVQLSLFHCYVAPWLEHWNREAAYLGDTSRWAQGLPVVWTEDEFYDFLRRFLAEVYERVLAKNPSATHLLDKHPAYRDHLHQIKRLIPGAKIIHMIRDGRDVAVSLRHSEKGIGFGYSDVTDAILAWKQAVQAGRAGREWPADYCEVRYEELLAQGADEVRRVFDFCGLPASEAEVQAMVDACGFDEMRKRQASPDPQVAAPAGHFHRGAAGGWRDELTVWQRYRVERLAGDLLRELGYCQNGNWWRAGPLDQVAGPALELAYGGARRTRRAWKTFLGH